MVNHGGGLTCGFTNQRLTLTPGLTSRAFSLVDFGVEQRAVS